MTSNSPQQLSCSPIQEKDDLPEKKIISDTVDSLNKSVGWKTIFENNKVKFELSIGEKTLRFNGRIFKRIDGSKYIKRQHPVFVIGQTITCSQFYWYQYIKQETEPYRIARLMYNYNFRDVILIAIENNLMFFKDDEVL